MRPEPNLPIEVCNSNKLEEGFYKDSNNIFYLSKKDGKMYVQYQFHNTPHLIQETWPTIFAEKVTSDKLLKELEKMKRFIESKLKEIADSA